jgi:major membrane immunogen (membrane-anchored lipoprotein)
LARYILNIFNFTSFNELDEPSRIWTSYGSITHIKEGMLFHMKRVLMLAVIIVLILTLPTACVSRRAKPNPSPVPSPTGTIRPEEGGVGTNGNAGGRGTGGNNGVSADKNSAPEGLADGVYTGRTKKDQKGEYGEIKITITNEKVAKAEYVEYTKDGKPKSPGNGFDYKQALEAFKLLPERLTITQNVDDIDDYSGATGTTEKFRAAARLALSSGKK